MATTKQKIAFKEVLKGSTLTKAMVKAGYSPKTATATGKLTNTDGWRELMENTLSDKKLLKVHLEGLSATKKQFVGGEEGGETVEEPDYATRHKYLESGYKIKGRMSGMDDRPNENKTQVNILINVTKDLLNESTQPTTEDETPSGESVQELLR